MDQQQDEIAQIKLQIMNRDMIVTCTLFSDCGEYLIASNNYGTINVWYLNNTILHHQNLLFNSHNSTSSTLNHHPFSPSQFDMGSPIQSSSSSSSNIQNQIPQTTAHFSFKAHTTPINAIIFTPSSSNQQQLLTSDDSEIKIWNWSFIKDSIQLQQQKVNQNYQIKQFLIKTIPSPQKEGNRGSLSERCEINGMDYDSQHGHLYFASGDGNAYQYDLETIQKINQFKGHRDYLHDIKLNKRNNSLITSSEDGTVRIWDTNTSKCQNILCPRLKSAITSNNNNNNNRDDKHSPSPNVQSNHWTGPIDLDETGNWLAVGGSIPSMWYLGKLNTMSSLLSSKLNESVYSIIFEKDRVLSCGGEGVVNYYTLDGKQIMKVPSTSDILYSLSYNPHQKNQILVASGSSPLINTYINQENIAFSFCFTNNL